MIRAVVARRQSRTWRLDVLLPLAIVALVAAGMVATGRHPFCECGTIRLWSGDVWSNENSQQLADAYSFTHVIHGVLFFWMLQPLAGIAPLWLRRVIALGIEAAWEIAENSDFVIQRYREATASLDYYGDSALNSVGDILFCLLGFWLATRLSGRAAAIGLVVVEVALALWIRDSLLLNIVMLLYPIEAIKQWQLAGAIR
jgi:hypothetical protein